MLCCEEQRKGMVITTMRIGIIGHFGGQEYYTDGQTVKTKNLYEALKERCECIQKIDTVDTYYAKRNPAKFFADMFLCIVRNKKIIVLLSKSGRKMLFPLLYWSAKILRREIYHDAIGGQLANEVAKSSRLKKNIASFQSNWMESKRLVEQLEKLGINNARFVPNFKQIKIVDVEDMPRRFSEPICFCTFSRVMREKGITDAIRTITDINYEEGRLKVSLDIYGPVEEGYKREFKEMLDASNGSCNYKGVISPEQSVDTLKEYFALLFPTFWEGEGMPGTIIDALSAGLPIIARKWEYSDEMLYHHDNALIYDKDHPEELKYWINYSVDNFDEIRKMRQRCLNYAQSYSSEIVIKDILKLMGLS